MKPFLATLTINVSKFKKQLSSSFLKKVVLGVSSGQDSIFLLFFLVHFEKHYKINIILSYCHHFWQEKNFFTVFQIFKIAYLLKKNVYICIPSKSLNSEDKARLWRQKNLYQLLNFLNFDKLLLGHTKTDQIETSLWNLVRGTGPLGFNSLKHEKKIQLVKNLNFIKSISIFPRYTRKKFFIKSSFTHFVSLNLSNKNLKNQNYSKKNCLTKNFFEKTATYKNCPQKLIIFYFNSKKRKIIHLQRPLLNFSRLSIAQNLSKNKIPFLIDRTNFSLNLMRNKFRLLLIPLINYYSQSSLDSSLIKACKISLSEQIYLNNITRKIITIYCNFPENTHSLTYLPAGLKEVSLKFLLEKYTVKQINFHHIYQLIHYIK